MKRYLKSVTISVFLLGFWVASVAVAEAGLGTCGEIDGDCFSQAYIGLTGGESEVDLAADTTMAAVDENPLSYGIIAGYRLNKFFSFEMMGNYFGEPEYTATATGNALDVIIWNAGLGGNFYLPLGRIIDDANLDFISVFAKAGVHYWDFEAEDNVTAAVVTDDGVSTFYGFGINLDLKRHFTIRAEHSIYEMDDNESIDIDAITFIVKF